MILIVANTLYLLRPVVLVALLQSLHVQLELAIVTWFPTDLVRVQAVAIYYFVVYIFLLHLILERISQIFVLHTR